MGVPCKAVSELQIPKSMDWSWWYTELATTVTGSEPIRLPCVGLHESYGVCTQGEHDRKTAAANFRRCKKHQNAPVVRTSSLVTRVRKCIQAGHFEQFVLSAERPVCNCTLNSTAQ